MRRFRLLIGASLGTLAAPPLEARRDRPTTDVDAETCLLGPLCLNLAITFQIFLLDKGNCSPGVSPSSTIIIITHRLSFAENFVAASSFPLRMPSVRFRFCTRTMVQQVNHERKTI
jgi:hypothetical protein